MSGHSWPPPGSSRLVASSSMKEARSACSLDSDRALDQLTKESVMRLRLSSILTVILFAAASSAPAAELKGAVHLTGQRTNADAVVYIDAIPGKTFPAPTAHAKMDQKSLLFTPHVLPVLEGTTVDFLNSDAVLHNVFSPDKCADQFNLGSWPQGQIRSYTFKRRCNATLLCKVHPEMEG